MAKKTVYWNRRAPFFVIEDPSDAEGFDSIPVEMDSVVVENVRSVRRLIQGMEALFDRNPAPEECAQEEADAFQDEVRRIFKTKAQDNRRTKEEEDAS